LDNNFLLDPEMIQEFLVESEELLQHLDQDMVTLEATPRDTELLNRIFRALHTIKGTSGFLGFDPVVRLSHHAEDVLNDLRRGEIQLSRPMIDALLAARDQLGHMLADIRQGGLKQYEINALLGELEAVRKPADVPLQLGEILVNDRVIDPGALKAVLLEQATSPEGPRLGELLVKKGLASPAEVGNALVRQKEVRKSRSDAESLAQTVRVDASKLDDLINLIGELVLERNRLVRLTGDLSLGRLTLENLPTVLGQSTSRLSSITEELQAAGLKTRMVPIENAFRKFPRLVRDVARTLEKEVELIVRGQDTEMDKTMVELVGDPLVHLVRNSLDHGLELPNIRTGAGKPRQGTIQLEARQEGDQIIIIVTDDGAGIDPDRVLRKAIERKLVTPERARLLSRREILDFIFLPGFSTVEKVNDLSGRGVGMDVVRSNLRKMNGTVELDSTLGKGTTILLRLPLTLAILPVLLVQVADEIYGLPLRSVLTTAGVRAEEIHQVESTEVLRLRGRTFPLLRLGKLFASKMEEADPNSQKVVILTVGDKQVALLVDHLVGQESTVIKPLSTYLHHCSSIAGATISGDGRVRLVLDPAGLLASADNPPRIETVQ
jgi:two-component system, chemotaxis family, sensor kinase CheA